MLYVYRRWSDKLKMDLCQAVKLVDKVDVHSVTGASDLLKHQKTNRVFEGHSEHATIMTVSAPVFYTGW